MASCRWHVQPRTAWCCLRPRRAATDRVAHARARAAHEIMRVQVDEKLPVEAVRAVLAERWQHPALAAASARELSQELQVCSPPAQPSLATGSRTRPHPAAWATAHRVTSTSGGLLWPHGRAACAVRTRTAREAALRPIPGEALAVMQTPHRLVTADPAVQAGKDSRLQTVLTLLARPVRLVRSQPQFTGQLEPDPALFDSDPERQLWVALEAVKPRLEPGMLVGAFLAACEPLSAPVATYFDNVRPCTLHHLAGGAVHASWSTVSGARPTAPCPADCTHGQAPGVCMPRTGASCSQARLAGGVEGQLRCSPSCRCLS